MPRLVEDARHRERLRTHGICAMTSATAAVKRLA
jgi:hypothetical protein